MDKRFKDMTIAEYQEVLGSKAPVPGGGGASAVAASLGACLGSMVASLTIGKKKYADVEEEMKELLGRAEALTEDFNALADEDAESFLPLAEAYRRPEDTENMEKCLREASRVPLEIMRKCCEGIDLMEEFAHKGSRLAVSDAGAGAAVLKGALKAASLNVYINAKSMKDREYAEEIAGLSDSMIEEYSEKADRVFGYVYGELK